MWIYFVASAKTWCTPNNDRNNGKKVPNINE